MSGGLSEGRYSDDDDNSDDDCLPNFCKQHLPVSNCKCTNLAENVTIARQKHYIFGNASKER